MSSLAQPRKHARPPRADGSPAPSALTMARRIGLSGMAAAVLCGVVGLGYLVALTPRAQYAAAAADAAPASVDAARAGEWTHFAGDAAATQYSPLAHIGPGNVRRLRVAWIYRTGEAERRGADLARSSFSNTPILAADHLIVCTPWGRVIALDPATGEERWHFDPQLRLEQPPDHRYVCRGVASWRDPGAAMDEPCAHRILLGTNDLRIFAIDARSGARCASFGAKGEIHVAVEGGQLFPGEVQLNGPPAVVGDVVVFGSTVSDHVRADAPSGAVRAFDVRTGEPRWQFDPVPREPADPAYASWGEDSAMRHGAANVWADMSVDEARGIVYLATSSPSSDHDGRDRPGDNRYANSVLALEGATGRLLWNFQIVRHDLWDYDLPAAPLLTTLSVNGSERDVAVQLTKQGLVFVLDRVTGEPVFPVEDRPVAQSDVAGERTSPTQPFPVTMPWLMRDGLKGDRFTADDAWGFTFWDRARCRERIEASRALGLYGPPSAEGTILYPWVSGGTNHGARAYDPERKVLVTNIIRTVGVIAWPAQLAPGSGGKNSRSGLLMSPLGAPCIAPPWGELVALDIERQQILWRVPLGTIEKNIGLPLRLRFGTPSRGGPLLTGSGLVFIAATMDDALRAFDTATGRELWRVQLPAGGQATPMTYMAEGRQYVVIAAGGHAWMETTPGDYVVAYALPDAGGR